MARETHLSIHNTVKPYASVVHCGKLVLYKDLSCYELVTCKECKTKAPIPTPYKAAS